MEKAGSSNVAGYVDRRLHPVRLGLSHLNRVLEGTKSGSMVSLNRDLLMSIVSTVEIFLEDFENQYVPSSGGSDDRKVSMDKSSDSPRVTQTRVS